MDDLLDGVIGFVISGFQWNFGVCLAVGPVVKETVGERCNVSRSFSPKSSDFVCAAFSYSFSV
jgi:hypothetical protein